MEEMYRGCCREKSREEDAIGIDECKDQLNWFCFRAFPRLELPFAGGVCILEENEWVWNASLNSLSRSVPE